jgi:predicted MPP superfamily phosphohydrolase
MRLPVDPLRQIPQNAENTMKIPAVVSFLGVVLLILGLLHAYLNVSFVTFFGITSPPARRLLAALFTLLAVSFVLSTMGVRVFPGPASRFFYAVSAVWFGAALLLVIASTPVWPVAAAARWLPFDGLAKLPRQTALVLYTLTALFIAWNVVNAHRLQVTRFSVSLRNLPEAWQGKTVAHISDVHLGAYWNESFLETLVEKTLALEPEMIVITGDLFDGSSGTHERFLGGLRRFAAPRGVYFISGNHEVYAGREQILPVVRKAGINVIDDTIVNLDGLQLIGIASPSTDARDRPVFDFASRPEYDRNLASILLYHTPTDINGTSLRGGSNSPYFSPRVSFEAVMDAGVGLQLSGHTHAGQFFPFTWLTEKIYGGFHYGLKRIGDFQIYIHSGTGTWAAPFRSGSSSEIALITLERAANGASP